MCNKFILYLKNFFEYFFLLLLILLFGNSFLKLIFNRLVLDFRVSCSFV